MTYTTLITQAELRDIIGDAGTRVIDCRFNLADTSAGRRAWAEGHIPGAVYAHLDDDLSGVKTASTGRHPLPDKEDLAERFRKWGINNDTQVIAYDAMGGAMASRLWWLARWLGHEMVAVLDGGINAWLNAGGVIEVDLPHYPRGDFAARESLSRNVEVDELQAMLQNRDITLIDARDEARFRGEKDNLDPVAGHVPGAVNHFFMQNLDETGVFRSANELKRSFEKYTEQTSPDRIVHMCGSGVTACLNILAMQYAGIEGPLLYAGSWSEWIKDENRPVARGQE